MQQNSSGRGGRKKIEDDVDAERHLHSLIEDSAFQDVAVHAYRVSRSRQRSIRESIHAALRTIETLWDESAPRGGKEGKEGPESVPEPPNPGRLRYRSGLAGGVMLRILESELMQADPSIGKEPASPDEVAGRALSYVDALMSRLECGQ